MVFNFRLPQRHKRVDIAGACGNDSLIFRNRQKVTSNGVELEVKGQMSSGLEGTASYSFQEKQDEVTDQLLSNSPRNLVKLSMSQPIMKRRLFVSLDARSEAASKLSPVVRCLRFQL